MYSLEYLPEADMDIAEAENYLYSFSPAAVDTFTAAIVKQTATLVKHPLMYPVYRHAKYLRCMPLPYQYLFFYHVDKETRTLRVYRVIRDMRDIPSALR